MYSRWLALTALAYAVCHHLGLLPDGLGPAAHDTQVADWLDLAVPFLVLTPALLTMRAAPARESAWWVFGAGAIAYVSGHGIHLAANSIGNAQPSDIAHFWDEDAGHAIWYVGVWLVFLALADTMRDRARPGPIGYVLAVAVGLTWASNAVGGGTELWGVVVAATLCGTGWAQRRGLGVVLLVGFLPAFVVLLPALGP